MNGNGVTSWYISLIVGKILDWIAHRLENVFRSARKPSIQQELPDHQITKSKSGCAENPESNFVESLHLLVAILIPFSKKRFRNETHLR